ncbi:MAG: PQQ-binding-like beta-propeller repeat protein [Myxococcota bacterium]|nr:PQQ-binding-like beta-propeller repeat protein [Myxococcota bacterium]
MRTGSGAAAVSATWRTAGTTCSTGAIAGDADGVAPEDGDGGEVPDGDEVDVPDAEGGDVPGDDGDACVPTDPEVCDGLDNDCDGDTDEGFDLGSACTIGLGACLATGVLVCAADGLSAACDAEPGEGTPETCGGEDEDCDGLTDVPSRILALDPAGAPVWSLPFMAEYVSPRDLAVGGDGTIYFGDGNSGGKFYAVNSSGTLKWSLDVGGSEFRGAPAIGLDGTIHAATWQYAGGPPAAVYAIVDEGDHGTVAWEFAPAGGAFVSSHSPAIGAGGTVYVGLFLPGTGNIVLYAIDPATGGEAWHYDMGATTVANSALAIGSDGTVYAKSTDGRVYAVLPDGTAKWAPYDTGTGGWYEAPALGADGVLYVGATGRLLCLDADDGSLVWEAATAGEPGSPAIIPNGTVFFPTTSAFFALCSTSPGLADAPWPKDLHEERNAADSSAR